MDPTPWICCNTNRQSWYVSDKAYLGARTPIGVAVPWMRSEEVDGAEVTGVDGAAALRDG